jgi:hypothetical protein
MFAAVSALAKVTFRVAPNVLRLLPEAAEPRMNPYRLEEVFAMRKTTYFGTLAALALAMSGPPQPVSAQGAAAQTATPSGGAPTSAAPQDQLAAASRRAKEQKKQAPKAVKVFTNENLPTDATISTVGTSPPAPPATASTAASAADKGEQYWRDKFEKLHKKLDQDQADLAVMQRELGVLNLQNYQDPVTGMQQSYTRADLDKKTAEIEAKKKDVAADEQAIEDAESDLQKAGGNPGWAR